MAGRDRLNRDLFPPLPKKLKKAKTIAEAKHNVEVAREKRDRAIAEGLLKGTPLVARHNELLHDLVNYHPQIGADPEFQQVRNDQEMFGGPAPIELARIFKGIPQKIQSLANRVTKQNQDMKKAKDHLMFVKWQARMDIDRIESNERRKAIRKRQTGSRFQQLQRQAVSRKHREKMEKEAQKAEIDRILRPQRMRKKRRYVKRAPPPRSESSSSVTTTEPTKKRRKKKKGGKSSSSSSASTTEVL